tara:strand:+ start:223 stop:384 length:162 start_codon:yes stop_codon:yes gene_type:complete
MGRFRHAAPVSYQATETDCLFANLTQAETAKLNLLTGLPVVAESDAIPIEIWW